MVCEGCGTENRASSRFCDHCGAPLSLSCPACGQPNRADALFCSTCGSALHADAPAAPLSGAATERRQVTVLFADLVGFTSFADGRDPERVRSLQQRYFDATSDAVTRHGGTVEKFIGDAVMAVWGTPIAREDDAQRAVRAGLEVVKAVEGLGHELAARAGIVTSQAAVTVGATDQAMVAGDMVNTAARLQASAEPGEVLADHPTVQAASGVIAFEPADERALRGKAAPMGTWRAVRVRASRAADVVEPPFVGRDAELRRLKDVLHATGRDRRVRLVSITGPAGVGKSRLVEELAGYAGGLAGVTSWHTGRSPSYGEGIAFWALGEMVRRCAGLAEADEPEATRARIEVTVSEVVADPAEREWIGSALLALLGIAEGSGGGDSLFPAWRTFFERIAARASAVLVFEDLQWADAGTLEFIEHLLDWSRTQPILVVTVARPDLLDARPGWGTARSNTTAITLQPLRRAEMQELLAGLLPGLPQPQIDEVVARSEGMPLYAVEMVRALLADGRIRRVGTVFEPTGELGAIPIPASLRSLLAARLDALAPDDRLLLQHASVVGLSFAADALAAVTGASESDLAPRLRDLVRRELLEIEVDARSPERGQYRFVQSLIREVAYETLGLRERRARHLAAAHHVETVGSDEAAGALASHYLAAYRASEEGPESAAVAAQARVSLRAAADRAAGLGAHEQAVLSLDHAIALAADPAERAELLSRAATSAAAAGLPRAVDLARDAVDAFRDAGDDSMVTEALALLGDVMLDASRVTEAVELLAATADEIEGRDPATWGAAEGHLFAVQARAEMRRDSLDAAIGAADRALVIAERRNLDKIAATALVNKATALSGAGRSREGTALLEGAIRIAERGGWMHLALRGRVNLAAALAQEDVVSAAEVDHGALDIAERIGDIAYYVISAGDSADRLMWIGERTGWEHAAQLIDKVLTLTTVPFDREGVLITRAAMEAMRGADTTDTIRLLDHAVSESRDPRSEPIPHLVRTWASFAAGRHEDAQVHALAAIDRDPYISLWATSLGVRAAIAAGDAETIQRMLSAAESVPLAGRLATASRTRLRAILAAVEGRGPEAGALFVDALSGLDRLHSRVNWSITALLATIAVPDDPSLRERAVEARAIFDRIDARAMVALLDTALV